MDNYRFRKGDFVKVYDTFEIEGIVELDVYDFEPTVYVNVSGRIYAYHVMQVYIINKNV